MRSTSASFLLVFGLLAPAIVLLMAGCSPLRPADRHPRPHRAAMQLPNAGFESTIDAGWAVRLGRDGLASRHAGVAHSGKASLKISNANGAGGVFLREDSRVPVRPGQEFRLSAWIKLENASGETYLTLEGYEGTAFRRIIGKSRALKGTRSWWRLGVRATIPAGSAITHLGVGLRSEHNRGKAWIDDVALELYPPNEPWLTGPPSPPPRGAVTAAGGQLVDARGQRIRLWGVNLVDEVGRDYRQIEQIACRIRQMGFNAVRLHLYDVRLIDQDARNQLGEPTSRVFRRSTPGDDSILDRFDYAIYCLEREGLYLYLTADRLRAPFRAGDYRVLPAGSDEHRQAWQEAVAAANEKRANEHLPYIDERLGAAQEEYLRQMLAHKNPYTGRRIADDPWVALWELTNENGLVRDLLEGKHRKWHPYWQATLRRRLAEWLRAKYGSEARLKSAWGRLEEHESLDSATIRIEPCTDNQGKFPARRCEDVRQFVYDVFVRYSRRLERIIHEAGSASAHTPVTYDTVYQHKHGWYYAASQGSCLAVGTYTHEGPVEGRKHTALSKPPELAWYNLQFATVADKPTVIYETNVFRPCPYRAAYPLRVAALAAWHDWDAVFFYVWSNGTVLDQDDPLTYVLTGLRYEVPSHTWHGIVFSTDEMFLAGARLAGEAFINFHLPVAPERVRVTIGRKDLLRGPLWVGDIGLPIPPGTRGRYPLSSALGATAFRYGVEYAYDMGRDATTATRPLIAADEAPLSPAPGLTYDWRRGTLIVDTPGAKIAAGFVREQAFGHGVSMKVRSPEFVVMGMVSTTPQPLSTTPRAVFAATSTGENIGAVIQPEGAKRAAEITRSWGHGPIQATRIHADVQTGRPWRWRAHDFLLDVIKRGRSDSFHLSGEPLFMMELHACPARNGSPR